MRITALSGCVLVAFVFTADAGAEPRGAARPVTRAELDRLEQKIEDQQRLLEHLVHLQQQYLRDLVALMPEPRDARPSARPEPRPDARVDARDDARPVEPVAGEPRPAAPVAVRAKPAPPRAHPVGTVVGKITGGGGEAFVYIEDVVGRGRGSATMKQENKQFSPRVLAVVKDTKVEFPNLDAVFHNVFSVTPDTSFDLGSYQQGDSRSVTMTRPGVVTVYCNMHPQMVGYVLVVPSPLYTRAGDDGFYRLANVPVGHHRLVAWAPNAKPVVAEIDVSEAESATVELALSRGRALPHTNKDGMAYGSYKE